MLIMQMASSHNPDLGWNINMALYADKNIETSVHISIVATKLYLNVPVLV